MQHGLAKKDTANIAGNVHDVKLSQAVFSEEITLTRPPKDEAPEGSSERPGNTGKRWDLQLHTLFSNF